MNIRNALGYSIVSKYLNSVIALATVVAIARMLTPEELGIYSIAAAIALIIAEFKSFGVGAYLIRSEKIDPDLVARALGLNIIIAWGAGLALFCASWSIQGFYDKPDIALLLQILSVGFFLNPHTSIAKSLMQRELAFDRIMLIDLAYVLVQFIATIALILADLSYYALALAVSLGHIIEFTLALILRPAQFVLIPRFKQLNQLASFGIFVTLSQVFRTVRDNVPDLILGKLGSAAQVAFYSRAMGLMSFLNKTVENGIRPVVLPYLASKKSNSENVGAAYLHASQLLTCILVPVIAVLSYASLPIIIFMFGDQWYASAGVLSVLGTAYIFRAIHTLSPQLLIASGAEKIMFYKDVLLLLLTIMLVYLLFPYGLEFIALAAVCVAVVDFLILTIVLRIKLDISILSQTKSIIPNALLTLLCLAWTMLFDYFILPLNATAPTIEILALGTTTFLVWFSSIFIIRHPLRIEIAGLIRKLWGFLGIGEKQNKNS